MPVVERSGDIPDYANCEVARINRAYKDDDEGNSQVADCMVDSLSITKEGMPLSALDKFGRGRMSYSEAASNSTTATQALPLDMMKTTTK